MPIADLCGILNLNKPSGVTSRWVVDRVGRVAGRVKAGHAGTLDPLASGVLVVCLGRATRLIEYVQRLAKTYQAEFLLGQSSPTDDIEGDVQQWPDLPAPSHEAILEAYKPLVGVIQQRPPAYSAIKVAGKRAYRLARQGEAVELAPRPVCVYRIEVLAYDFPMLRLRIECGSGTYVRALGRDLAASLGTHAVMSQLVRTAIGGFDIGTALAPESLAPDTWSAHLRPAVDGVAALPRVAVSEADVARLRMGQFIARPDPLPAGPEWAAVDATGSLIAILVQRAEGLGPRCNLA